MENPAQFIPELHQHAMMYYRQGRFQEAENCCVRLLQAVPDHAEGLNLAGIVAFKMGKIDLAVERIEEAILKQPGKAELFSTLGFLSVESGKLEKAVYAFQHVTAMEPENADAYYNLALTQRKMGALDEAIENYRRVVGLEPENIDGLFNLANALTVKGENEAAVAIYQKIIFLNPNHVEARNCLGNTLVVLGRAKEAIEQYESALAIRPEYNVLYKNTAGLYYQQKRFEEAAIQYLRFLKIEPGDPDACNGIGIVYKELGDFEKAIHYFDKAIQSRPYFAEALYNKGSILHDQKKWEKALNCYEQSLEIDPSLVQAIYNKGTIHYSLGQIDEAIVFYQKTIALKSSYLPAHFSLVTALFPNGSEEETRGAINNALAIKGLKTKEKNWLIVQKAMLAWRKGRFEEVECLLEKAKSVKDEKVSDIFDRTKTAYYNFLVLLLKFQKQNEHLYQKHKDLPKIYIIGDSHALGYARTYIHLEEMDYEINSKLIPGLKAYHLSNGQINQYKQTYLKIIEKIPEKSTVIISAGEIDCRPNEGIYTAWKKSGDTFFIRDMIAHDAAGFVRFIVKNSIEKKLNVYFYGVPAPKKALMTRMPEDEANEYIQVPCLFSRQLKQQAQQNGCGFIDSYGLTNNGQGISNNRFHIDEFHLYPSFLQEAMEEGHVLNPEQSMSFHPVPGAGCLQTGLNAATCDSFPTDSDVPSRQTEAYYKRALISKKQGKWSESIKNFQEVIRKEPEHTGALFNLGNLFMAIGKIEPAIDCYKRMLQLDPVHAVACNALGNAFHLMSAYNDALSQYLHAIKLKPDYPEPFNNAGIIFQNQGKHNKAAEFYEKYLALKDNDPGTYNNLGTVYHILGKMEQARFCFIKALDIEPDFAEALYNLGNVYYDQNQLDKATDCYNEALKINPELAEAYNTMGIIRHDTGKSSEAIALYLKALKIKPDFFEAYNNLGIVYYEEGKLVEAETCYEKAIDIKPDYYQAYNGMANILSRKGEMETALGFYQKALKIHPDFNEAVVNLFETMLSTCSWDRIEGIAKKLDELNSKATRSGKRTVESPLISITRKADPSENYKVAKSWAEDLAGRISANGLLPLFNKKRKQRDRITIGYISNNFASHPVAHQMAGMYRLHNRNDFQIFCYSCGPDDGSDYRKRIMQDSDRFVDLLGISDPDAAKIICKDDVDILVDLMGYTRGSRMGILALRPAPIQIGYLGFLGSTGADFMDYFITDKIVTPQDHAVYYTEKFIYMPHCYQVNDNLQVISKTQYKRADFSLPEKGFIFCSFNNPVKIDQEIFGCWMEILKRVPDSVLWLQGGRRITEKNLRKEAEKRNVSGERLVFSTALPLSEHLARLKIAGLALDTTVYNGGATTSNALWAGVPVIAKIGSHLVSRMTASSLHAIGLPELIAETLDDYKAFAVHLAENPDELASLKKRLNKNRMVYPFFDTGRFVENLEKAFQQLWRIYLSDNDTEQIVVNE